MRAVVYIPFWCRFGLHRWRCTLVTEGRDSFLLRYFHLRCRDIAVHVHACRRCGRVKVEGGAPPGGHLELEGPK